MLAKRREFSPRVVASAPASDCRPVTASDFCTLLVSRRRMLRVDELGAEVRGLLDRETGVRYVVDGVEYCRSLSHSSQS